MEIKICPANPLNLPGILKIVNHNILHSTALYDYDPKTLEYIETWFAEKQEHNWPVIVALENDKVAGYGTYGPFRFKDGFRFTIEHSVYAAPEQEGRGIGKLLLTELIRLAKEGGYHCMIGGIDADNKGSIEFHKRFGFVETGIIKEAGFKFGKWLDLQFMQLILE
ncbi:GNAT family N-acetyltransferase [uncultured Flavobacterium sp.]|uniref:GNAT family N-acetyltransferase n=1 Tax=uncultured Flavobacterium sp. TaxID=165435 RepID=UPI0025EA6FAF|nr:GNAT family N-acetyltransferase [uncultured Flavobacterium sp.]